MNTKCDHCKYRHYCEETNDWCGGNKLFDLDWNTLSDDQKERVLAVIFENGGDSDE